MAFQFRQGTESERSSTGITPAMGELIHCTDSGAWYGGDGATTGGNPVPGAIGQHLVDTPTETGGVPRFDRTARRWRTTRISLQALGLASDVAPQDREMLIWRDDAYTPEWPAPEGTAPIALVESPTGDTPTRAALGTIAAVSDDNGTALHVCTTGGAAAAWERLAFASELP